MTKRTIITTLLLTLTLLIPFQSNTQAATFSDVSSNHWAYTSIENLANKHIINGYKNGTYMPEQTITRAQAAIILASALDLNISTSFEPKFQDVSKSNYAYNEIKALTEKGIFANATNFNPDATLTRAQMAKLLTVGYQVKIDDNDELAFRDVTNADWQPYIITLAEIGVSKGVTWNSYNPYGKVTRAQMAAFIDRAMTWDEKRDAGTITYDAGNKTYVDKSINIATTSAKFVNDARAKEGKSALTIDAELSRIAKMKAEDMVKNNYFDHTSPTYGAPWDMATHFGYTYRAFGENIAYGQRTPDEVVNAWLNSPGHYANIMGDYNHIGAGTATDSNGRIYWVHMFAKK